MADCRSPAGLDTPPFVEPMQISASSPLFRHRMIKGLLHLFLPAAIVLAGSATTGGSQSVRPPTDLTIALNVPAFRLDVFRGTDLVRTYQVAVGQPRYQTPIGEFTVSEITWNPWWYPPDSKWAEHEKITPPGPNNPMGKVKIRFGGKVYFHETPLRASMGRAASHACVRMLGENAVDLARLVQKETQMPLSETDIDSLTSSWKPTRSLPVPRVVKVRIVYQLAEIRGDSLLLHPDVYRLATTSRLTSTVETISRAGYDTTRVARDQLRVALKAARSRKVSIPVVSLIKAPNGSSMKPTNASMPGRNHSPDPSAPRASTVPNGCG
jgi:hypothetical protein